MRTQDGVLKIKPDHRNYSAHTFGATFAFPTELNLDAGFGFPDQNALGLPEGCTAFAQSELCQDEDKAQYQPKYTYEKTIFMMGIPDGQPCDMPTSLKSTKVYGVLGKDETTDLEASKHIRGAYYQVEKNGDWFDGIRSAMTLNKCSVSVATQWFGSFERVGKDGIVSNIFSTDFSWHNYAVKGWKIINGETYLIVKSWQGSFFGDDGYCYFSRSVINRLLEVSGSGAFIVAPYDPSNVQTVKLGILQTILSYFYRLLALPKPMISTQPPPEVPVVTQVETKPEEAPIPYLWDNFENSRHSCRVIMDEEGLTYTTDTVDGVQHKVKDILCACIHQESNFNNKAIGDNGTSKDWGIVQINDHYQVGPGKPFSSTDEIVNNPDKAVRFMISMYKAGKLSLWSSFSSGAFKKYL